MKMRSSLLLIPALTSILMVASGISSGPAFAEEAVLETQSRVEMRSERMQRHKNRATWLEHIEAGSEASVRQDRRERAQVMRENRLRKYFSEFDLNRNGSLTEAEMVEVMTRQAQERAQQMFRRLDTDGTGVITEDQFVERLSALSEERRERVIERRQEAQERRSEALERMQQRRQERGDRRRDRSGSR